MWLWLWLCNFLPWLIGFYICVYLLGEVLLSFKRLARLGYSQLKHVPRCTFTPAFGWFGIGAFDVIKDGAAVRIYVTKRPWPGGAMYVSTGLDGHVTRISTLTIRESWWGFARGLLYLAGGWLCFYPLNSYLGGYNPYYNSDGTHWWGTGVPAHSAIIWQPRVGSYLNQYNYDLLGWSYRPLLMLDRHFIHKTHYVFEPGFAQWWMSLKSDDIHPDFRDAFQWWAVEEGIRR